MPRKSPSKSVLTTGAALVAAGAIALAPVTSSAQVTGPDVSSWQGPDTNWGAVRAAGNEFAIVKATESTWYTNPHYLSDSIGIKTAGLIRGTYHYADPSASASEQAYRYAAVTLGNNLPGDLPPVIDIEDAKGRGPAELAAWLREFLTTTEAVTGKRPIIYTYPYFWRNQMANTTEFSSYPLWIAEYNGRSGPSLPLPGGWQQWAFWQYTSSASIPGIGGRADHNFYGGVAGPLANMTAGGHLGSS